MHSEYDDDQDRRDTAEELHNAALAKRDRQMDHAPAGTTEPPLPDMPCSTVDERAALGRLAAHPSVLHLNEDSRVDVLPRDLDDHPLARDRVNQLAEQYDSVEVDRLPPMGALHWLITAYRADGSVDTFRVGASGSLMPWPVKP